MAHLYRVVLALVAFCCSASAFAVIQLETSKKYAFVANSYVSPYTFTSASSACSGLAAHISGGADYNATVVSNTESACTVRLKSKRFPNNQPITDTYSLKSETTSSCPANSNPSGPSTCQCVTNFTEEAGVCVKKPLICDPGYENDGHDNCNIIKCGPGKIRVNNICVDDPDLCPDGSQKVDGKCKEKSCKADQPLPVTNSSSMPFAMCDGGCIYQTSNAIVCNENAGVRSCARTYYSTGGTCNDKPSKPGESGGGDNSGDNGGSGGDNGGTGGSGGGSGGGGGTGGGGGSNDKPDSKPNIPGTDPDPGTGKCGPGTYMSGGKCYPNTTDQKPTDTGTDDGKCPTGYRKEGSNCIANQPEPDDDKDKEFCKENPEVSICKKGAFDGACDGNFKCEGDAIQCAIARDQHIRNCQAFDKPNDESKLYDLFKNKTGKQTGELPGNETFNIGNSIDMSNALGGGSCVQDLTIDVYGASVTLEVSRVCPWLDLLGNILVACALVLAIRIVFRG